MGGICRLIIKAYSDNSFNSEKGEFVSTINPTNLKISTNIYHNKIFSFGNNNFLKYNHSEPRIISFSLLLDNTCIFPGANIDVKKQIDSLESLLEGYQKDINEPYYVRVIWGTIDFKGKLNKLFINYSYIKEGGDPARAEVDVEIIEHVPNISKTKSQKENKSENNKNNSSNNSKNNSSNKDQNAKNNNNNRQNKDENNINKEQAENNVAENKNNESNKEGNKENDDNTNPNDKKTDDNENVTDNETINEEEQLSENTTDEENNNKESENNSENNEQNTDSTAESDEDKNNKNNKENEDNETNNDDTTYKQVMVKEGDSLPGIISESLKLNGLSLQKIGEIIKKAICKFAEFNLLDSIRKLIKGFIAKIPNITDLIKKLIKKAKDLIKRGITFIKKKGKSAKNKTKEGFNKIKNSAKNSTNKVKNGTNKNWDKTKETFIKGKNKITN